MTISAITIENFKGIGSPVRLELKPITLLFGANSAGKSTVFQALLYAREILARRNTDPDRTQLGGDHVDLGGFRNLIHNHDQDLRIALGFELNLSSVDLVDYADIPQMRARSSAVATEVTADAEHPASGYDPVASAEFLDRLSASAATATVLLTVRWSEIKDEPVQADYEVSINGEAATRIRTDPATSTQHLLEFNGSHPWFRPFDEPLEATLPIAADAENSIPLRTPTWRSVSVLELDLYRSTGRTPETLIDEIADTLARFNLDEFPEALSFSLLAPAEYLLSQLNALRYLGPIREVPPRTHLPALSPDASRWANGLAAWDMLSTAPREKVDEINSWLGREDRLATGYRIEVKRFKELDTDEMLYLELVQGNDMLDNLSTIRKGLEMLPTKTKIILRQERDFLPVSPQDVGIGISQLIPVVVSALDAHDGITVIEQPELHIHPAIQVGLGDLFIARTGAEDALDRVCILETHSEHLLLRLLRRIREAHEQSARPGLSLGVDHIAVYYVESAAQGTVFNRLRIDEDGDFVDPWPKGFFEERRKELF